MNIIDFSSLELKFGSFQKGLGDFFDFGQLSEPVFKKDERYCPSVVEESDDFQTLLVDNFNELDVNSENTDLNNVDNYSNGYDDFLVLDLFGNVVNDENSDVMVDKVTFNREISNFLKKNFGIEDVDEFDNSNVLVYPDNRFSMIKRVCPNCGHSNANSNGWEERKYKNKGNKKVNYYLQSYICKECGEWFITPINFNLNDETKKKINLDNKILKIHANTGLSFDKIAEILEITMNVNVSHEYIRNIIQREYEDFIYKTEIIPLPQDFKKKGKTSQEREVTDIGRLLMFKKKDIQFCGAIEVDELFTGIDGRRNYLVTVFANEIKDMPIATAIINTRHFEVMKRFFEFIFEEIDFKALTSDMLGVYKKIAKEFEASHQLCIFHWMKYQGKKIFDEIKKEEYSKEDKIWFVMLFTQMKEILRNYDTEIAEQLLSDFKNQISEIPEFLKKITKKFLKDLKKLTTHTKHENMMRTTGKAENFNSLPQIRHKKHTSKSPRSLLYSISSIINYYKPNYRTLRSRI
jgi:transposase-like protein/Asp-tRNA(Asn)/Glu-tRNA(Gln) amidotransferase C subunit